MAKIFLVDDDYTNARLIKILLEMDGFSVAISPDINRVKETELTSIDAFIIDCHLAAGQSGLELLRAIRNGQTSALSTIPIIMTSGDYRQDHQAIEAGATIFMLKPYPPNDLSKKLTKILSEANDNG